MAHKVFVGITQQIVTFCTVAAKIQALENRHQLSEPVNHLLTLAVLHPDREPDEVERERKTELMQRVNEAYRKKDLLQLLALQLEIEQIDQQNLNTLADDRLKHFNKILQEQLSELEQEIDEIELPFRIQLNISPYAKLSPESIIKSLSMNIRDIQFAIKEKQKELDALQDPVLLKSILKSYRL